MKKLLVLLLALCMVFTLCACGGDSDSKKTDDDKKTEETKSDKETEGTKSTEAAKKEKATYTVKVVDDKAQPLANVKVLLCLVEKTPVVTDASGVATFADMAVETYSVQLEDLPDGYKADKFSYFFDDGSYEMTITIKSPATLPQNHIVKVVDESNNPVAGAKVTFTKQTGDTTVTTQADGVAKLFALSADYTVTVEVPEGYAADTTEYKFAEGTYELTITLKAAA